MRSAPTFGYLAWGAAVLVGVVVGCSSESAGPPTSTPPPGVAPSSRQDADDEPPPDFEADFDAGDDDEDGGRDASAPDATTGTTCIDKDDPGSAENVAKVLPPTDDCDDSYKTVSGIANGPVDVDYYMLSATDKGVSTSHPVGCKLETDFVNETAGVELCVFARCKNSTVDAVEGCERGTVATSDIGMKGCCASGTGANGGQAIPKWDCTGITDDDSADFFFRVKQVNSKLCLPYKFRYRY